VGFSNSSEQLREAVLWNPGTGFTGGLGVHPDHVASAALTLSADGSVIGGCGYLDFAPATPACAEAVLRTARVRSGWSTACRRRVSPCRPAGCRCRSSGFAPMASGPPALPSAVPGCGRRIAPTSSWSRWPATMEVLLPVPDTDGDGIPDDVGNCIDVFNPDQRDTDGDGCGNRCDADLNNDGIINFADLAIFRALFGKPPGPSALAP
jgi:hypothetical protein